MTAYLLDTNAFSMALTDDPRLPASARAGMMQSTRLALSVISLYEIGQKVRLGKWPEMAHHVHGLEARAREDGYDLISLSASAALEASLLEWRHRDPFDRIIAVVARREALTLLSADAAFDDLEIIRHWD